MAGHEELWNEIYKLRGLVNGLVRRESAMGSRVDELEARVEQIEGRGQAVETGVSTAEEAPEPEPFFLARR